MNNPHMPAGTDWNLLAAQPMDALDTEILGRVATMFDTVDPVPAELVERLQFAISLDALEFELAVLELGSDELMAARSDPASAVKSLTFTSDSLTTMVNIAPDGPDRVRIDGWLAPAGGARVELHQGTRVRIESADADGRFAFTDVEHGLTRFTIHPDAGSDRAPVATPAVQI